MQSIRTAFLISPVVMLTLMAGIALPGASTRADQPAKAEPAHAPIFSDIKFADALEKTKGTDKVLIVKFTAVWCGPCKMMDKTTFRDESVVSWIKEHGTAISVDVDVERDIAQSQGIIAMPTTILFKDGEKLAKKVGYLQPQQFLEWLTTATDPNNPGEQTAKVVPGKEDARNMQDRMSDARELMSSGKNDDATTEYLWMWKHMLEKEPAMVGVRGSFMASELQMLCSQHVPAKDAFTKERDDLTVKLKTDARTFQELDDWLVLNTVIGDEASTLAWFDRIKGDAGVQSTFDRERFRISGILKNHKRWADLSKITPKPVEEVTRNYSMLTLMGSQPEQRESLTEYARSEAGGLYMIMLAGNRADDARKVAEAAIKHDDKPETRLVLVQAALATEVFDPHMLELLDQAEKGGKNVTAERAAVQKGLGK